MTWWKLLFLLGFLIIASYVTVTFYFSDQPWTIEAFSKYLISGTQNIIQNGAGFIQDKWQLVTGTLGVAITAILGLYRTLHSKFTQVQQTASTAQTQVKDMEAQAIEQYNSMKTTIDGQQTTITSLKDEIVGYKQQVADAPTQVELDQAQSNYEQLQRDYNVMENTYQKIIEDLKQKTVTVYQ